MFQNATDFDAFHAEYAHSRNIRVKSAAVFLVRRKNAALANSP